jgi:uncharacterized membrane protein (Fun14 family)
VNDPAQLLAGPLAGLGFGGLLGAAVGYTVKKITKLVLLAIGLCFIAVQVLVYYGFLHVDWPLIESAAAHAWRDPAGATLAQRAYGVLTANLPFGGGFIAGLAIGLRLG